MTIKFTFLLFITSFCFSCASFSGIERRHYCDGVYFNKHHKENKFSAVNEVEIPNDMEEIKMEEVLNEIHSEKVNDSVPGEKSEQKKTVALQKKNTFSKTKLSLTITPIEVPKEPFNKKAKTAVVFYMLAKIMLVAAFVISLFSLISTVLIVACIAALFALIAIAFGILAKKELAAQLPYEKELGEKEANDVVGHALGGIIAAIFIILLAIVIEWLKKRF